MPGIKPTQQDIEQFVAITQASHEDALHFLEAGTTLEGAIEDYYAAQTAAAPAPSAIEADDPDFPLDEATPAMSDPNPPENTGGPRTLSGEAAEPLPAGWGQPERSRFGRIEHNDKARGRGEESDDDDPEEFYAGGEKSGLAVENPNQPKKGNSAVDRILKMAKQNGPSSPRSGEGSSSKKPAFHGRGNVLGSEETPSAEVPSAPGTPGPSGSGGSAGPGVVGVTPSMMDSLLGSMFGGRSSAAQPPATVGAAAADDSDEDDDSDDNTVQTRRLTFWRNGFSIEDGPLLPYDEPQNQQLLQAIEAGRAPPQVFGVRFNQRLNVEVAQRRQEEYQPPPKQPAKPFGGSGNRLGSATPEVQSSSSPMPGGLPGILVGGSGGANTGGAAGSSAGGQTKFEVDDSKPTTSVQLRLADGTRLVARVNLTHTVSDLWDYVSAARPDSRTFVLQTTFPNRELSNGKETIEEAKLQNAVVVQRFI